MDYFTVVPSSVGDIEVGSTTCVASLFSKLRSLLNSPGAKFSLPIVIMSLWAVVSDQISNYYCDSTNTTTDAITITNANNTTCESVETRLLLATIVLAIIMIKLIYNMVINQNHEPYGDIEHGGPRL